VEGSPEAASLVIEKTMRKENSSASSGIDLYGARCGQSTKVTYPKTRVRAMMQLLSAAFSLIDR
jgi:hypothetical protein